MNRICKFAAYSMLAATLLVTPAFAQEAEEVENNSEAVEMTEADKTYMLPELAIDAERATYQALITRPQDEITPELPTFVARGLKASNINAFDDIHSVFTVLKIGPKRQSDVRFLIIVTSFWRQKAPTV